MKEQLQEELPQVKKHVQEQEEVLPGLQAQEQSVMKLSNW